MRIEAGRSKSRVCPLCGGPIPAGRGTCPSGCPLARSCKVVCCPSCGYSFVEDSALVSAIGRLVRWVWRRDG